MGEKLVIGPPIGKGLRTDRTAFAIDNDSFPVLINAYQWRGRVKRKRGTGALSRLQVYFDSTSVEYNTTFPSTVTLSGSFNSANILTGFGLDYTSTIVPGTVNIVDQNNGIIYQDNVTFGVLTPNSGFDAGFINYANGVVGITGASGHLITASFSYYSGLPTLGLEDFYTSNSSTVGNVSFDTEFAYSIPTTTPSISNNVTFYNNPASSIPYVEKTLWTPFFWNSLNYQQYWTTNYQNALWVTNGIQVPFKGTNVGMQYQKIQAITNITVGPPAIASITTLTDHGLVIGDFVFINEIPSDNGMNFQTGYVTSVTSTTIVVVTFPKAVITGGNLSVGGIIQYLTSNLANPLIDCLKWYNGDPTNGTGIPNTLDVGWVNFCPPLSQSFYSIANLPPGQYYLVSCKMIIPFKDRLLFIGPVVQTSSGGAAIYLQDTVIFSQNGTPYYTCSFSGKTSAITNSKTQFTPLIVPDNQTAIPSAYWNDQTGFGGYVSSGLDQPINTASTNEDAIIMGLVTYQTRFVYTGNELLPFTFYIINAELGSASTYSVVNMDEGVITRGNRGFVITSQTNCQRFDLEIPDQVFQLNLKNNGNEQVCSNRDFINEWIYFTYNSNDFVSNFPNQTLQYNYRDQSWAIFNESYTTYGQFRVSTGNTWGTIGKQFPTWADWNVPWNSGTTTLLQPQVIAGNQQGFVVIRDVGTGETPSLFIQSITFPVQILDASQSMELVLTVANNQFSPGQLLTIDDVLGMTDLNGNTYQVVTVTATTITLNVNSTFFDPYLSGGTVTPIEPVYSPNHGLNNGDYIRISGATGSLSTQINGNIFSINGVTINGFMLNPGISSGTYFGLGVITRYYVPMIQTKQFPMAWGAARKTRIGPQMYLFSTTPMSQIQLLIFLSQDSANSYNDNLTNPNDSLIYSTVLYTCPESINLGLTPMNINLMMPTASTQQQIWHRMNTSLIGDTVQIGFTMSDEQMRSIDINGNPINATAEIELHSAILDINQSQMLV